MKFGPAFLALFLIASCASGNDKTYTGSTPGGPVIKKFLGIPLTDSIDFIRWKLVIHDNHYDIQCNYGIGKPNTNGFMGGGKKIELNGLVSKEKNQYRFQNGNKVLKAAVLNADLLQLLNEDNSFLTGTAGWSYTLNNISPSGAEEVNMITQPQAFKDSMVFVGRTPCKIPGLMAPGEECYKLKWKVTLFTKAGQKGQGTYKIRGTRWRDGGNLTGEWKIIPAKNGWIIYQLNDEKGEGLLYLLNPGEHILLFTDAAGKPLVGDEDFSYTLNREL